MASRAKRGSWATTCDAAIVLANEFEALEKRSIKIFSKPFTFTSFEDPKASLTDVYRNSLLF